MALGGGGLYSWRGRLYSGEKGELYSRRFTVLVE